MTRPSILIRQVTHLTDARYFAAMGVDWMSLRLTHDPASFHRWHTIRDWVEGVRLIAEIDAADEALLAKAIIDATPDGLLFTHHTYLPVPTGLDLFFEATPEEMTSFPSGSYLILPYVPGQTLPEMDHRFLFLQAEWTETTIAAVRQSDYEGGFCMMGGEEEATGVRDYEKMDRILEFILMNS